MKYRGYITLIIALLAIGMGIFKFLDYQNVRFIDYENDSPVQKVSENGKNPSKDNLFSFRNIPFDQSGVRRDLMAVCLEKEPNMIRCEELKFVIGKFEFVSEYGLLNGKITVELTGDGRLESLSMHGTNKEMLDMILVLEEKYGSPAGIQKSPIGYISTWRDKDDTRISLKRGKDNDLGSLSITTKAYRDKKLSEQKTTFETAVKKL